MTENVDGLTDQPGLNPASPWVVQPSTAPAAPLVEDVPARIQTRIVAAAGFAGFVAQVLVVRQSVGINLIVWVALVLAAAWLLRRPTTRPDKFDLWLPVAALAFAIFPALRSDGTLIPFDTLAAGALTLASVVSMGGTQLTRRSWTGMTKVGALAALLALSGAAGLNRGTAPFRAMVRVGHDSVFGRVLRGLGLALPLLIIFALLFTAADEIFAFYLRSAIGTQLAWDEVLVRALVAAAAGWLFAGTLVATWMSRDVARPTDAPATDSGRPRLATLEAVVVLLVLDAVFGLFVARQAAYLFGGLDTLALSGMTYSEYARRGFFELVVVAVLSGAVVLALDSTVVERSRAFRLAAAGLAVLTGVVLLSAIVRLGLYQQAYGWTELRFFTLVGISWLAVGVVATVAGVLLERAAWVPRVMVGAGLAIALVVNAIGPQAFVADQNLARAVDPSLVPADGKSGLDAYYLGSLGDDVYQCSSARSRDSPTGNARRRRPSFAGARSNWRPSNSVWAGLRGISRGSEPWRPCAQPATDVRPCPGSGLGREDHAAAPGLRIQPRLKACRAGTVDQSLRPRHVHPARQCAVAVGQRLVGAVSEGHRPAVPVHRRLEALVGQPVEERLARAAHTARTHSAAHRDARFATELPCRLVDRVGHGLPADGLRKALETRCEGLGRQVIASRGQRNGDLAIRARIHLCRAAGTGPGAPGETPI